MVSELCCPFVRSFSHSLSGHSHSLPPSLSHSLTHSLTHAVPQRLCTHTLSLSLHTLTHSPQSTNARQAGRQAGRPIFVRSLVCACRWVLVLCVGALVSVVCLSVSVCSRVRSVRCSYDRSSRSEAHCCVVCCVSSVRVCVVRCALCVVRCVLCVVWLDLLPGRQGGDRGRQGQRCK